MMRRNFRTLRIWPLSQAGRPSLLLELPCLVEHLPITRLGHYALGSVEVECAAINVASFLPRVIPVHTPCSSSQCRQIVEDYQ